MNRCFLFSSHLLTQVIDSHSCDFVGVFVDSRGYWCFRITRCSRHLNKIKEYICWNIKSTKYKVNSLKKWKCLRTKKKIVQNILLDWVLAFFTSVLWILFNRCCWYFHLIFILICLLQLINADATQWIINQLHYIITINSWYEPKWARLMLWNSSPS